MTLLDGSVICSICHRKLRVKESVDRGIGPVCWKKYAVLPSVESMPLFEESQTRRMTRVQFIRETQGV